MGIMAFLVFLVLQIAFIPLAIIGILVVSYRQLVVSRRLGVSATALSAMGRRQPPDPPRARTTIKRSIETPHPIPPPSLPA
jgi:hypothetical protein